MTIAARAFVVEIWLAEMVLMLSFCCLIPFRMLKYSRQNYSFNNIVEFVFTLIATILIYAKIFHFSMTPPKAPAGALKPKYG